MTSPVGRSLSAGHIPFPNSLIPTKSTSSGEKGLSVIPGSGSAVSPVSGLLNQRNVKILDETNPTSASSVSSTEEKAQETSNCFDSLGQKIPSLTETVKSWGKTELQMLKEEYLLAQQITGEMWSVADTLGMGPKLTRRYVAKGLDVTAALDPQQIQARNLATGIHAVALAYSVPVELGKIAVLLYKHILLSKIEDMLRNHAAAMTSEDSIAFQDWIDAEKEEVSRVAKQVVFQFGTSLPGNILTLIRVCQFNVPILRLGLGWVATILEPILIGMELKRISDTIDAHNEEIQSFKQDMFRTTQEGMKTVVDKRREDLLQRREEFMPDSKMTYEEAFRDLIEDAINEVKDTNDVGVKRGKLIDFLEEKRLAVNKQALEILSESSDITDWQRVLQNDNMLARFIDVHTEQPKTDSALSALKTIALKQQKIKKKGLRYKLTKTKILLAAVVVSAAVTIFMSLLTITGVVTFPAIVLMLPSLGVLGLASTFLVIGVCKFYHEKPNLFKEYVKGSLIKIAAYGIPKKIREIQKRINAIKVLKASLDTQKLQRKIQFLESQDSNMDADKLEEKKTKMKARIERLAAKSEARQHQIEYLEKKIAFWEAKILPISQQVEQAQWRDFYRLKKPVRQEKPENEGSVSEEEAPIAGVAPREAPTLEESLGSLRDAIKNGITGNEEMKRILHLADPAIDDRQLQVLLVSLIA